MSFSCGEGGEQSERAPLIPPWDGAESSGSGRPWYLPGPCWFRRQRASRSRGQSADVADADANACDGKGQRTWERLRLVFVTLKPWEILLVVALGIVNVFLSKLLGYIPGDFYYCLAKRDRKYFVKTFIKECVLISVCTVTFGSVDSLAELASLRWRKRLTLELHRLYSEEQMFYRLSKDERIDHPDQRIQRDVDFFSASLSNVVKKIAASPFKIVYFTVVCFEYLEWNLMLWLYFYFVLSLAVQKFIVAPLMPIVVEREKAEASFRSSHIRIQGQAEEIALTRAEQREKLHLDARLQNVLFYQKKLVLHRWFLSLSSSFIDYLGAVANYALLAYAIFSRSGVWDCDASELPRKLSNATFVVLQLVFAFSTLSDTAKEVSNMLGYTERVGELLYRLTERGEESGAGEEKHLSARPLVDGQSHKVLVPPRCAKLNGHLFEYSIHKLDRVTKEVVQSVFADLHCGEDADALDSLLALPTFQFPSLGVDFNPQSGCPDHMVHAEMNKLHLDFVSFENRLRNLLLDHGKARGEYFCDSIDPLTGAAMHGACGTGRYSEARGAVRLLGYKLRDVGTCPLVLHPRFGSSTYPATLFSNAPVGVLEACVQQVLDGEDQQGQSSTGGGDTSPDQDSAELSRSRNLVRVAGVTIYSGHARKAVISNLTLNLNPGDNLYVLGPSGSGKTALVRAMCGLWDAFSGTISLPDIRDAVVLPQSPLLLSGGTMAEQIVYPSTDTPNLSEITALMDMVGLGHLRSRALDTGGTDGLSKAEIQKLCFARVVYHRPRLAVLDSAADSLSAQEQAQVYGILRDYGITYVSTGDSSHLAVQHKFVLHIMGDDRGSWDLNAAA